MADLTVTAAQVAAVFPRKAVIIDGIAGEAITAGQAVYQITSSGKYGVADANVADKQQVRGIALNAAGAGQAVAILKEGHVYGFDLSSQSYDDPIFLSDTAGALADATGTLTVPCGLVVGLADKDVTKVLYVQARYGADYT